MGYTFLASQYMNGYHFYIKSISMGYLFHPKSIWMGKIWKIVYEWGQYSKIVYEWGQFSIWEVYEWVMFFTWPSIWMGWGSGTPAAHPYPKSWHVNPPPAVGKCRMTWNSSLWIRPWVDILLKFKSHSTTWLDPAFLYQICLDPPAGDKVAQFADGK